MAKLIKAILVRLPLLKQPLILLQRPELKDYLDGIQKLGNDHNLAFQEIALGVIGPPLDITVQLLLILGGEELAELLRQAEYLTIVHDVPF